MLVQDVCRFLDEFAPPSLAAEWDNVGLLVGDTARPVRRIMTCLTITPSSASEAVRREADLIVTHHPLPFRPLKRLTADTVAGRLLLQVIEAGIAVHSPHSAFDSAAEGINRQLAEGIGLSDIRPLVPLEAIERAGEGGSMPGATGPSGNRIAASHQNAVEPLGAGRYGRLDEPLPLAAVAQRLKDLLDITGLHQVGASDRLIDTVAVACGSAGEFLGPAAELGCHLLVTGETSFHTCLEAEALEVGLLLPGHYASERFAVDKLAGVLAEAFPALEVWASGEEQDPLQWV